MKISETLRHRRNDRADSTLVTFILVFPLFFSFLVTMVDTSMYFANRAQIQQVARDSARSIAIFGGGGNSTAQTPLEYAYGIQTNPCAGNANITGMTKNVTVIECDLASRLWNMGSLTNVGLTPDFVNETAPANQVQPWTVSCGPQKALRVNQEVFCEVRWRYRGLPFGTLNFINRGGGSGGYLANNVVRSTALSEVGLSDTLCVPRDLNVASYQECVG